MPTGINLKELIKENIMLEIKDLGVGERFAEIKASLSATEDLSAEEVIERAKKAVKGLFKDAQGIEKIFFKIALRLDKEGFYGEAIFYYRLSNLLVPNEGAINNLAVVYSDIGREAEAVKILKEGTISFPDSKVIRQNLEALDNNAIEEVQRGKGVSKDLASIAQNMDKFQRATSEIDGVAQKGLEDAKAFLKGAEQVATAAEELASSAEEARKGTEMQTKAFGEMSTAAQELSSTAEELKTSTDAKKSAEELAAMAEELSANIEEASSAGQELAQAIEQIRTAEEMQAKEAQSGAERAEKLATASRQIEARAQQLGTDSENMSKQLADNKVNVDKLIENINKASEDNMSALKNIKLLEEKTRKIEKTVEAIMNVTIQTNMLAVSGSIEAARAGEHGKGFSVVAGDIRNLANESAENADKIKDMVRNLQGLIQKCIQDIDMAARNARSEAEKAKISAQALIKIDAEIKTLQEAMRDTLNLAQESLKAIEEAKKGVDQISAAAEEASKAVSEAAAASEEQARGLQELSQAIEKIASLADEMQSM